MAILEKAGGCADFLVKPFAAADLSLLLKKHLHLELAYANAEEPPAVPASPLSAADLSLLPREALVILHRLAIEGDDSALGKWMAKQDCLTPAAKAALTVLIKGYRFDVIQKLAGPLVLQNASAKVV